MQTGKSPRKQMSRESGAGNRLAERSPVSAGRGAIVSLHRQMQFADFTEACKTGRTVQLCSTSFCGSSCCCGNCVLKTLGVQVVYSRIIFTYFLLSENKMKQNKVVYNNNIRFFVIMFKCTLQAPPKPRAE